VQRRWRFFVELVAALDRRGESSGREQPGGGGGRVGEQPLGRGADERGQGAERAGERGHRVIGAKEAGRVVLAGGMREHRLLERGERSRFDDVGGHRAGQSGDDQRGQPFGEREDGAGDRHRDQQQSVAAPAPNAVTVAGEQHGDERTAGEQRGEHGADGRVGEAAIGEGDANQDRAEAVGQCAGTLDGDDPACVGAQPRSS
jgi:hypothetical protein